MASGLKRRSFIRIAVFSVISLFGVACTEIPKGKLLTMESDTREKILRGDGVWIEKSGEHLYATNKCTPRSRAFVACDNIIINKDGAWLRKGYHP